MIRVAAIGAGYWGPNLIRNLYELEMLAAVCDLDQARLDAVAGSFGVPTTTRVDEILADRTIDAVAIATPAPTHAPLGLRALDAGKHVFVEKPLALSSSQALELVRAAKRCGRQLMVGHLLEYHPAFLALRALVEEGELGELRHIRSSRLNLGKLRQHENVLWSFAPHDLSLLLRLTGREPKGVQAKGLRLLGTPREDTVYADLDFGNGLSAHLHVSWLEPQKFHQFVAIGTKRMAIFNDILPTEKLQLFDKGFDAMAAGEFQLRDQGFRAVPYRQGEPMRTELEDFRNACLEGRPPLADGPSGYRVVRALELITAALHEAGALTSCGEG